MQLPQKENVHMTQSIFPDALFQLISDLLSSAVELQGTVISSAKASAGHTHCKLQVSS
jgi:hypothetical protein